MSEQDVSTMRNAYEAFNRADIPAVLEAFDPQIEWHEPGGGRAPQGTFSGAESVANDVFATVPETSMSSRPSPRISSTPASTSSWSAAFARSLRPASRCRRATRTSGGLLSAV
jgi:ketosteroid isomerase-like protein